MIPFLKALENFLYAMDFHNCPWDASNRSQDAYVRMGKVTSVTFTYTFIHALFFMLAKGWNTTNQNVDRN